MEIKLEISDEKFNEFIGDLAPEFTLDMKKEAIHEAVKTWGSTEQAQSAIKNCLLENCKNWNDSYTTYYDRLSDQGKRIISEVILSDKDFVKSVQDQLLEMMNKDGRKLILEALMEVLIGSFTKSAAFEEAAERISRDMARDIVGSYLHNNS